MLIVEDYRDPGDAIVSEIADGQRGRVTVEPAMWERARSELSLKR